MKQAIRTWVELNKVLLDADESLCRKLIELELNGRRSATFLLRIHSRLNKIRAGTEREELTKQSKRGRKPRS